MEKLLVLVLFALSVCAVMGVAGTAAKVKRSNIVFLLTDDQDVDIGGLEPMSQVKKLIGDAGAIFTNMFVTTPLCCPSRSSILTGRYVHNHGAVNNSLSGNCSSRSWQKGPEGSAFPVHLKQQGYKTFFAGKYLNQYGDKEAGGAGHIPPGWDEWHGLMGNSRYYNYSLSVNGRKENHGDKYSDDYLTDLIGRRAISFIENQHQFLAPSPFFMMLSTPACHAPFTPSPQYSAAFANVSAPRTRSFDVHGKDKHWLVRAAKNPMSNISLEYIDHTFRNRWRTLLSVDDIVEELISKLKDHGLLDNTYIVFSSDNGFHLGQFSLPNDKRQMYEFDIHVPLMIRGPNIKPNQVREEPVLNIDLAPTFIDLAGGTVPPIMDGRSLHPLLETTGNKLRFHASGNVRDFIVEHQGEHHQTIKGCPQYDNMALGNCAPDCVCEDAANNTYVCLRAIRPDENLMYCQFSDSEDFTEMYDLNHDPQQLTNIASVVDPNVLARMDARLVQLSVCAGTSCQKVKKSGYMHARTHHLQERDML